MSQPAAPLSETYKTVATVIHELPEYHQVIIRNEDDYQFAITDKTAGVDYRNLRVGQKLECTVTRKLPRVLDARLLP